MEEGAGDIPSDRTTGSLFVGGFTKTLLDDGKVLSELFWFDGQVDVAVLVAKEGGVEWGVLVGGRGGLESDVAKVT